MTDPTPKEIEAMVFRQKLRDIDRETRRRERQDRRRKRRERIARLLGIFAGMTLGTNKIGWVLTVGIGLLVLALIWRMV